jgi:cystathionine beta-lyase
VLGQYASPDDCWLALRGARSMGVRMERQMRSAIAVGEWLRGRSEIKEVLHPALPGARGHEIWKRDFTGACSLFGIVFRPDISREQVFAMAEALQLFGKGASWGGFESLALPSTGFLSRTAGTGDFGGQLMRLHVGLEDVEDLTADLAQGLAVMNARR